MLGEESLAPYVSDPVVNFTTMGLIIMSGLGFVVWWDLWDKIKKVFRRKLSVGRIYRSLRLHSKIVVTMTAILVIGGTVLIFLFDFHNPDSIGTDIRTGTKLDGIYVPGCDNQDSRIFYHKSGAVFQCNLFIVSAADDYRWLTYGYCRWNQNDYHCSPCNEPSCKSAGEKRCGSP